MVADAGQCDLGRMGVAGHGRDDRGWIGDSWGLCRVALDESVVYEIAWHDTR